MNSYISRPSIIIETFDDVVSNALRRYSEMRNGQAGWDKYFLEIAEATAKKSKDPSTKVGALIVRPDKTIASTGFNGFPRKMKDDPELYANREEKYKRVIHAEMNALIFAKEDVTGYTLYTWPFMPCGRCALHMAQAGIKRVVAPVATPEQQERWKDGFKEAEDYFKETGVMLWIVNETTT